MDFENRSAVKQSEIIVWFSSYIALTAHHPPSSPALHTADSGRTRDETRLTSVGK